ncbi:MAG: sodium:solute symporter [Bacteroidales bacterium 45-6]|nr:MAG: sodium:solute symporter [Bacteroidales bacterium 45-6]
MTGTLILIIILCYFSVLLIISHLISRKNSDNDAFFLGNRKSPWFVVAIGMIGTSISGVTFISVPGMIRHIDMTYMQMVFGFFVGYLVIAYVLLPIYYKLQLTTIYEYLGRRLGFYSYKTGASFFLLSRVIGSAARLYLVAMILQTLVFARWNIPFPVTVMAIMLLIWAYTFRSGVKTIIWTDLLQTLCFLSAIVLIIWQVSSKMGHGFGGAVDFVTSSEHFRIFVFDDWGSKQHFVKQFLSGIFITIVMSGLDQDIMQKNLTCKSLKEARKNMLSYGFAFIPINFVLLCLGILLLEFAAKYQIALPDVSDKILPILATEYLGFPVLVFFTIGIIAAAFASADSALASLTTSVCVDLLDIKKQDEARAKKVRMNVHFGVNMLFVGVILAINYIGSDSIIDAIYKIASYTYGPLLGMFAFGLFTKWQVRDRFTPYVAVLSPVLCYGLELLLLHLLQYKVGYEILLLNGLLTFVGLWVLRKGKMVEI